MEGMRPRFRQTDTHPETEHVLIEGYRRMSPQQKLQQVNALTKMVQQFALARIRKQYPRASEHEQQLRVASLWLGRETMIRVFRWDPDREGY
jgi:hypothetical protein